jgi:hypothetical protein
MSDKQDLDPRYLDHKLPSRYINRVKGCEGRLTMLKNLKTDAFPEGIGDAAENRPYVCVVDCGNESGTDNYQLSDSD